MPLPKKIIPKLRMIRQLTLKLDEHPEMEKSEHCRDCLLQIRALVNMVIKHHKETEN